MNPVLIVFAHPTFQHSRVNRALFNAAQSVSGVKIHDLYQQYPDFHINVAHEQQAMLEAHTIILQHPFHWYSCPSLMKEWLDVVLTRGWAYGSGGEALKGKRLMSVISTGGPQDSYQKGGSNYYPITELLFPFDQSARLCGMDYQPPLLFHGALRAEPNAIAAHANHYQQLLTTLVAQ